MSEAIKITVVYDNDTTSQYVGSSFQHGDKALVIQTFQGGMIGVPSDKVKVYHVEKVQIEEPDSKGPEDAEVPFTNDILEAEQDTKKEEA